MDANDLDVRLFIEPFAGGASVALDLLHRGRVDKIGLMDLDPLVASFWKVVFFDTDWLVKRVRETEVSLDLWKELKRHRRHCSDRERAFACLYLNRTSFSGILNHKAGPLGGQKQLSKYKIDCRFPQKKLAERIEWLGNSFRDRVLFVWNWSWKRGIAEIRRHIPADADIERLFVYLDPPFYNKAEGLYNHFFSSSQHKDLRNYLANLELPWFLSYDDCNEIRDLYRTEVSFSVNSLYNAGRARTSKRKMVSELLITNLEANFSEIKFPRRRVKGTNIVAQEGTRRVGNFSL